MFFVAIFNFVAVCANAQLLFLPTTRGGSIGVSSTFAVGIGTDTPGGGNPNVRLNVYNAGLPTHTLLGNPNMGSGGYTGLYVGTSADQDGYSFLQSIKSAGSAYGEIILNEVGGSVGIGTRDFSMQYLALPAKLAINGSAKIIGELMVTPNISGNVGGNYRISAEDAVPQGGWMTAKHTIDRWSGEFHWLSTTPPNSPFGNAKFMKLTSTYTGADLFLNGELNAKLVRVKANNPWADYVFEKNYKLLPLADVERFVEKNKHLPEIPSAKEIEKNGQDLGGLQVLQMQKIEELTLYLIAQEKRIQLLEQKLLELQKKK